MERKILVLAFLVLAAALLGYYYLTLPQEDELKLGSEIDLETFSSILSDAEKVFIVMDVRDVDDPVVKMNVLQCGVDFAGSYGLVRKNLSIYSFDSAQGCVGIDQNYPISHCLGLVKDGIVLYVEEGNATSFYTNALKVGIGDNYTVGACSVNVR